MGSLDDTSIPHCYHEPDRDRSPVAAASHSRKATDFKMPIAVGDALRTGTVRGPQTQTGAVPNTKTCRGTGNLWRPRRERLVRRRLTQLGTGIDFRTSATTPLAVPPEKRAWGSMTMRCAITGAANS